MKPAAHLRAAAVAAAALLLAAHASHAAPPAGARLSLASSLRASGEYSLASLEYRRLAADLAPGDPSLPGLFLAAADSYLAGGEFARMGRMIDAAEDCAPSVGGEHGDDIAAAALYLRLRRAEGLRDWPSAAGYAEELARKAPEAATWASREAAAFHLRSGDFDSARAAVAADPDRAAAVDGLASAPGKSPRLGGILGIVPGLGYAYSGEYGNMFRSMFLNGIFGWAMFECADHDRWGLFSVTAFFELTWYTGSIYGGIDAAHRYNRSRAAAAAEAVGPQGRPRLARDAALDFFSLRLEF